MVGLSARWGKGILKAQDGSVPSLGREKRIAYARIVRDACNFALSA
jgi:hypothetical protein